MGRWPAARGEARLNTAFHPLRRSLFASLWLGTGLLKDPLTVAGLVLLGAPALVARASVVVVGGWLAFCMRRYGVFDVPEGPISKQVHSDLMAGAQPHFDETGASVWVGGDPADCSLRLLPALITQTLHARR